PGPTRGQRRLAYGEAAGGAAERGAPPAAPVHAGAAAGRAAVAARPRGRRQQGGRRAGADGAGAGGALPVADRAPRGGPRRDRVPMGDRTQWIVIQWIPYHTQQVLGRPSEAWCSCGQVITIIEVSKQPRAVHVGAKVGPMLLSCPHCQNPVELDKPDAEEV